MLHTNNGKYSIILKNVIILIFAINLFSFLALFRGVSLGQDINKLYLVLTFSLSVIFGFWLFVLGKKSKIHKAPNKIH